MKNEWPFTIHLIPREKLFADASYQRPANAIFVEKLVETFDPTLVGTLDVSKREDGKYALLDGLQRHSALTKMRFENVWCAVYEGMSITDEARFFYRRNRDRRSVHPFYQFRARVLMGEKLAKGVEEVVTEQGFVLHINATPENHISAIRAAEDAYSYASLTRSESLTPTLRTIREAGMIGRKGAKDGNLIRGLGRFYQSFADEELDHQYLYELLAEIGPLNLIGRVRENWSTSGGGGKGSSLSFAREIAMLYNKGANRKLPIRQISGTPRKPRK